MKLKSVYSSQKDFYGKANVIVEGGQTKLKSYSTIVAVKEENKIKVKGWYSKTTANALAPAYSSATFTKTFKAELSSTSKRIISA